MTSYTANAKAGPVAGPCLFILSLNLNVYWCCVNSCYVGTGHGLGGVCLLSEIQGPLRAPVNRGYDHIQSMLASPSWLWGPAKGGGNALPPRRSSSFLKDR